VPKKKSDLIFKDYILEIYRKIKFTLYLFIVIKIGFLAAIYITIQILEN
jgi:hypothetical protein